MFPMKKPGMDAKKPLMFDDPADDVGKPPHAEPEGDEMDLSAVMGEDITQGEQEPLVEENQLGSALEGAGYNASEDQLARIEAILKEPAKPAGQPAGMPGADKGPSAGKVPAALPPL